MTDLEKAFCLACGAEVPLKKVDSGIEGDEIYICAHCEAYLGTRKTLEAILENQELSRPGIPPSLRVAPAEISQEFHSETSSVAEGPLPQMPGTNEPASQLPLRTEEAVFPESAEPETKKPKLDTIILAEDSELVTRILGEMIVKKGLGRRVISCKNGFEFVISYLKSRQEKLPIGLIILDVIMPVLNGISAAVAIRSWEKSLRLEPVPILFFTAKRCDETFKRVLQYSRPAMYINKGASESAVSMELRIEKVINQLLKESF